MFVILRRSTPKNLRVQRPFATLRVTGYKDTQGDTKNCQTFHARRNKYMEVCICPGWFAGCNMPGLSS
jgi:hypothetical protein